MPELVTSNAQAVLWIDSATAVSDGIKALRSAGSAAQVVTLSNNASAGFIKLLGTAGRGVIVTQVFPYEKSYAYSIVKEALELAKAKNLEVSPAMLEGFSGAKVLVEAIRRASPNPTRQKCWSRSRLCANSISVGCKSTTPPRTTPVLTLPTCRSLVQMASSSVSHPPELPDA